MHRILVIEDDFLLLELIKELLELRGFYVITTNTYQEGYDLFTLEQPDFILCNYPFFDLNSLIIMKTICDDAAIQNIPLLFMLNYQIIKNSECDTILKQQDILFKPFSSVILLEKISTLLQI